MSVFASVNSSDSCEIPATFEHADDLPVPLRHPDRLTQLGADHARLHAAANDHLVIARREHASFDDTQFGSQLNGGRPDAAYGGEGVESTAPTLQWHEGEHIRRQNGIAVCAVPDARRVRHRENVLARDRAAGLGLRASAQHDGPPRLAGGCGGFGETRRHRQHGDEHRDDDRHADDHHQRGAQPTGMLRSPRCVADQTVFRAFMRDPSANDQSVDDLQSHRPPRRQRGAQHGKQGRCTEPFRQHAPR